MKITHFHLIVFLIITKMSITEYFPSATRRTLHCHQQNFSRCWDKKLSPAQNSLLRITLTKGKTLNSSLHCSSSKEIFLWPLQAQRRGTPQHWFISFISLGVLRSRIPWSWIQDLCGILHRKCNQPLFLPTKTISEKSETHHKSLSSPVRSTEFPTWLILNISSRNNVHVYRYLTYILST